MTIDYFRGNTYTVETTEKGLVYLNEKRKNNRTVYDIINKYYNSFFYIIYWNFIHQNKLEKFIYKKYLHEFRFSKTENSTEEEIQPDNIYQMHGNQITVKTLDLNQKFDIIAKQLDNIVKNHFDI